MWGGDAPCPGKPSCSGAKPQRRRQKTDPQRRPRGGEGAEGGKSTGSTDDPGLEKPGNKTEEKPPGIGDDWYTMSDSEEDPPFTTVNTHPSTFMGEPENPSRLRGHR